MKTKYLCLILLSFTACAPLVVRQPVVMPVVSQQPDGSLKTNAVTINGYVPGPALEAAKPVADVFGPYGQLSAIIAAAGVTIYTSIKNKQELKAHISDAVAPDPKV